jgi:ketosteroid isomerase-like protein
MIRFVNFGSARLAVSILIQFGVLTTVTVIAAAKQPETAVAQIRSILQAQQDAWNRGDIDGFMNGYARLPSTVFISEDTVRRGWETVRNRYRRKYSSRSKMGMLTFSDLEIRPLSSDSAVAIGRWKLKRASDQPHGRFTLILRRLPEGWRIVHDQYLGGSADKVAVAAVYDRRMVTSQIDTPTRRSHHEMANLAIVGPNPHEPDSHEHSTISPRKIQRSEAHDQKTLSASVALKSFWNASFSKVHSLAISSTATAKAFGHRSLRTREHDLASIHTLRSMHHAADLLLQSE